MFIIAKHFFTVIKLALLLFGSQSVMATNLSFTGNFSNDNDVQFFDFSIAADSASVIINTFSLNGGTNSAGDLIAAGGFEPYLSLWNKSTGVWVFDTYNKNPGDEAVISNTAPNSYGMLLAGNYILALTQFDNVAAGAQLSDGFAADIGLATFGSTPFTGNGGGGSGHWAVDILNVDTASVSSSNVPTPETLTLILIGFLAFGSITRRKLSASTTFNA